DTRTLSINDVTVVEGDGGPTNAVFTVTLSAAAAAPVTVNFATRNNSAVSGADYTARTGTLTFAPGTTTQTVTVMVTGDSAPESTEQFFVDLSGAVNASIDNATGTGRMLDNDTRTLSINDVTVVEGDGGPTNAVFTVTLSEAAAAPVTVNFATRNNSAVSGADYTARTGTLTFGSGERSEGITVMVTGESAPESTEQFFVDLSGAVNASIDNGTGTGRIQDNDTRTLSINDVTVVEGDGGTTNAVFTVTLSAAAAAPVTVNFATRNNSAISGTDYTARTGTLTF